MSYTTNNVNAFIVTSDPHIHVCLLKKMGFRQIIQRYAGQ